MARRGALARAHLAVVAPLRRQRRRVAAHARLGARSDARVGGRSASVAGGLSSCRSRLPALRPRGAITRAGRRQSHGVLVPEVPAVGRITERVVEPGRAPELSFRRGSWAAGGPLQGSSAVRRSAPAECRTCAITEREGFEPSTSGFTTRNALAGRRLQPLGHLSRVAQDIGRSGRLPKPGTGGAATLCLLRRGAGAVERGGLENR